MKVALFGDLPLLKMLTNFELQASTRAILAFCNV